MTTFALIHGAWHGSWCWKALSDRLAAAGYPSIASNLPCDDTSAGWREYRDVVLNDLHGVSDDVVLVGHSLGGCVVPLVAAERSVSQIVLLCSFPPRPGSSLDEAVANVPELTDQRASVWRSSFDEDGRHIWPSFEAANHAMYHDCDAEIARAAFARLRPQAHAPFAEPWPLALWPDTPVRSIVCSDDRMGNPKLLRQVALETFGVEPVELPGSHSPFVSEPDALSEALISMLK